MKIFQAENSLGSKTSPSGVSIKWMTGTFLSLGSYVKVVHDGKEHHFYVSHVLTGGSSIAPDPSRTGQVIITATETGYHGPRFKHGFDPRLLLDVEVVPITDPDKIEQIRKESFY